MVTIPALPRYKSYKEVRAAQITQLTQNDDGSWKLVFGQIDNRYLEVSAGWFDKFKPHSGGYYVVYEDGYVSFSPAEAFENGYARI